MTLLSSDLPENSVNVEALVNSAKRFLEKPEYHIQLHELFSQETDRLLNALDAPEISSQVDWDQQEFTTRVKFYEGATEPLAKMVGVLGRWGDGSDLPLVLDIIRILYTHAKIINSGYSGQANVRSYPAVLIFTAYGIGLAGAQRWGSFHELCSAEIARENQEPARLIETLFLWDWEGGRSKEIWQQLEGLEKRQTPLSDHLCILFLEWGKSFAGLTPDYEMLYERFEVMGSLAHLSSTSESDLESELNNKNRSDSRGFVRMPIGRTGWNGSTYKRLFQELESRQKREALVKTGFVESEQYIDLFKTNFNCVVGQLHWC